MPESITFSVALPPACLSPNSRAGWRERAAAKKAYAETVWFAGCEQAIYRWRPGVEHPWEQAAVHLTWYSTHQKDQDNIIAHCKGLIDGLSSKGQKPLGIFVDDKHITVTAEWKRERVRARGRIEVTVTKRETILAALQQ